MVLRGYKEIAAFIASRIGDTVSIRSARGYGVRADDPIPVRRFGNRVFIDDDQLDIWVARQWKPAGARGRDNGEHR
jgi:hypothetical protein